MRIGIPEFDGCHEFIYEFIIFLAVHPAENINKKLPKNVLFDLTVCVCASKYGMSYCSGWP